MNYKAFFTRIATLLVLGAGFAVLATQTSFAAPQLPISGGTTVTTPIYVGNEAQVRTGALGILVPIFLSGTKFEVQGSSMFANGMSILNNPFIINGYTRIGLLSDSYNLDIAGGNLIVSDPGSVSTTNQFSPSNIQIEKLSSSSLGTGPICATQSGQLVRC